MFWKKPKDARPPEWLIVGLGNPGGEYAGTRHNVGFEVIERLSETHRIKLDKSKHRARMGIGDMGDARVCLVRPLTYMNLSGQSVGPLARDYGILPDHILVIADDLDLPVGKLRLRLDGSAGGHNGHKSLIQHLKTQNYPRIRIGIGKADGQTVDHVLSSFSPAERDLINPAVAKAAALCQTFIERGPGAAQVDTDDYNKKLGKPD